EFDIIESEFHSYHISHIKCLILDDNKIVLSLDPYDENITAIEERDNFKIGFKRFKLKSLINIM
ncbi:MAG: hypothetical protein AAFO07_24080, partial [Bacteroidota bacterium]